MLGDHPASASRLTFDPGHLYILCSLIHHVWKEIFRRSLRVSGECILRLLGGVFPSEFSSGGVAINVMGGHEPGNLPLTVRALFQNDDVVPFIEPQIGSNAAACFSVIPYQEGGVLVMQDAGGAPGQPFTSPEIR
jgi:hypothetical protein